MQHVHRTRAARTPLHPLLSCVGTRAVAQLTNVGQHARVMLTKLGFESSRLYAAVGMGWVGSFFLVRILPAPFIWCAPAPGAVGPHASQCLRSRAARTMLQVARREAHVAFAHTRTRSSPRLGRVPSLAPAGP
jgi:hypothetical protein